MEARVFQFDQRKLVTEGKEIYDRIREKLESEHKGESSRGQTTVTIPIEGSEQIFRLEFNPSSLF